MKIIVSICAIIAMVSVSPVCMAADKAADKAEAEPDTGGFLSQAISSVTDKLDKVSSGEEKILDDNARGMEDSSRGSF